MLLEILALLVMVGSLFLIPLGIPGLWVMLGVVAVGAVLGEVGWMTLAALLMLGIAAELAELAALRSFGRRYGGSPRAFWGAIAGGMIGLFVGLPVPVVGPLITGLAGTFAGAAAVTLLERRTSGEAARAGWGVLLARVVSIGIKVGAGVAILAVGGGAILVG